MRKWMCVFIVLLLTTASVLSLAESEYSDQQYGDMSGDVVTLMFRSYEYDPDALGTVLQEFFEETGITTIVKYTPTTGGWAGHFSKMQTLIAAGEEPDMIRIAVEGFRMFHDNDLIASFNPYFELYPEKKSILDELHPKIMAPYIVDGEIYGLTFEWNNVLCHINLNILEEAGLEMPPMDWDLDMFLEYAQKMTFVREDGTKVYGTTIPAPYFEGSAWLFNNNASILNEDMTESVINSPEAVEVMQFLQDLIYKYEVAPAPLMDVNAAFMSDQVGMNWAGRWMQYTYLSSGFEAVDIVPIPKNATNQTISGSGIFPILKSSKNKEAAFLLACKLASESAQMAVLSGVGSIPSNIAAMQAMVESTTFPKNTYLFAEGADTAKSVESPTKYAAIQECYDRYKTLIFANEMDAQTALDLCKAEMDDILMYD